uniref:SAM domain-containing protein n=2 Tax=Homalodisca liturata TaxID=320908 RepID=A0A1B6I6E0_9HEMI
MATVESPLNGNKLLSDSELNSEENEENITELQEDWGEEYNDVVTFLCGLHLNQYVETFVDQGINLDIFLNLSEDDLCHIGMTDSKHRASLLQGISQLKQNKRKMSDTVQLTDLSSEEVNAMMANTLKHLTVIHASLAHMRLNLRNPCVHNSLINLKLTSAGLLEILTAEADIQAQLVMNQTNALLAKKPGTVDRSSTTRWKFKLTVLSGIGIVCGLLFYAKKAL